MTDNQFLIELGAKIKATRKNKKISLLQLAQSLEMEKPNVARIERGGNNITILNLRKIAKALNVSLIELINLD